MRQISRIVIVATVLVSKAAFVFGARILVDRAMVNLNGFVDNRRWRLDMRIRSALAPPGFVRWHNYADLLLPAG